MPEGMGDEQEHSGPQKGGQCPVKDLKRYEYIDQYEDHQSDPEGRALESFMDTVTSTHKTCDSLFISPFVVHLQRDQLRRFEARSGNLQSPFAILDFVRGSGDLREKRPFLPVGASFLRICPLTVGMCGFPSRYGMILASPSGFPRSPGLSRESPEPRWGTWIRLPGQIPVLSTD